MKVSMALPQTGRLATLEAVGAAAALAEDEGFDGVWALDRLLVPVDPRDPYPATASGVLSPEFERTLDPLAVLTFAAARTERVRIGTSVLVAPWYPPVLLARSLASLDVLSAGRLDVGLGAGWSRDEQEAAGVADRQGGSLGTRMDEIVEVLHRAWNDDVVEYHGRHVSVPACRIGLEPVQRPRPPLYFSAYTPAAMARLARWGDGWLPAGLPIEAIEPMWAGVRQMAEAAGRDASALKLVVRANVFTVERQPEPGRTLFSGDIGQIADDLRRCRELGAHEVLVDLQFTEAASGLPRFVDALGSLAAATADVREPALV